MWQIVKKRLKYQKTRNESTGFVPEAAESLHILLEKDIV